MNTLSISGKNWILKKYNQEEISFLKDNFLESHRPLIGSFKITAAAITGPAKQPLPTSSTPAINITMLSY